MEPLLSWAARNPRIARWRRAHSKTHSGLGDSSDNPRQDPQHRAVIIGYGPVGQTLSRLLRSNEIEPTIIEMNVEPGFQLANFNRFRATANTPVRRLIGAPMSTGSSVAALGGFEIYHMRFTFVGIEAQAQSAFYDSAARGATIKLSQTMMTELVWTEGNLFKLYEQHLPAIRAAANAR
mgnify:CR=1 FL=1